METSLSSCGYICTELGTPTVVEVEEKEELKQLLQWDEFFIYVMVDHEIFNT